jgi:hypothetical protein
MWNTVPRRAVEMAESETNIRTMKIYHHNRKSVLKGVYAGLHSPGYLYTHRYVTLSPSGGSVHLAWAEVGRLLQQATEEQGQIIGQKAAGTSDKSAASGKVPA